MRNRVEEIKSKGFNIVQGSVDTNFQQTTGYNAYNTIDFNKIKIGAKSLEDAVLNLGELKKINPRLADKENVLRAINNYDLKLMREISDFFYKTSGIYARMLRHMAFIYRYDWFVTPYVNDETTKKEKILDGFHKSLNDLEKFGIKKTLGEIALKILRQGAYYGYKVETGNGLVLQELPVNYCRSRFYYGNKPAVEFNMKFFDDNFRDTEQRMRVLKMFPKEFAKGYSLYKLGKLKPDFQGDENGWYLLDVTMTEKFTANGEDYPAFISVIPLLIDLDNAQDMDRKKTMQRLLKIVIQKLPLDKNGDLIFDVDEAQQIHNNAVHMLGKAIGLDVLTTFADVEVASMSDSSTTNAQTDDLERIERQVYNEWGGSQMLFNTDGNVALEKSLINDAGTMYNMLLQFETFLNEIIEKYNKQPKKVSYKVQLLTTTVYNYQEMAKLYKEQTQLGYSKMLPQIALGQTQSSVLANAFFENDILNLVDVFIPPLMSSTMNENILNRAKSGNAADPTKSTGEGAGRKELADDKKSEKTIQNRESMG